MNTIKAIFLIGIYLLLKALVLPWDLLMGDCARRTKDTISGMWLYRNDSR